MCMQGGMRRLLYAPGTLGYCPDEALPLIQQRRAEQAQRRKQLLPINLGARRYVQPTAAALQQAGRAAFHIARPGASILPAPANRRLMATPRIIPAHGGGARALQPAPALPALRPALVGAGHKATVPALAVGAQCNLQRVVAPQSLELTPAYDVYGLGVTILEVLSGLRMSKMDEGVDYVMMPQPLVDFRRGQVGAVRKAIQQRYPTATHAQMDGILELCKQCVEACREDRCTAMQAYKQLLVLMQ